MENFSLNNAVWTVRIPRRKLAFFSLCFSRKKKRNAILCMYELKLNIFMIELQREDISEWNRRRLVQESSGLSDSETKGARGKLCRRCLQ